MKRRAVRVLLVAAVAVTLANALEDGTWALVVIGGFFLTLYELGSWSERRARRRAGSPGAE